MSKLGGPLKEKPESRLCLYVFFSRAIVNSPFHVAVFAASFSSNATDLFPLINLIDETGLNGGIVNFEGKLNTVDPLSKCQFVHLT